MTPTLAPIPFEIPPASCDETAPRSLPIRGAIGPEDKRWLRGVARAAGIAAVVISTQAEAQDTATWGRDASHIRLQETQAPGAVAEVEFKNAPVHSDVVEFFDLTRNGLTVSIEATLGRGMTPDDMTVTPPDGYIAVPSQISVPEGETMVITIYSAEGAGA